jgi:hypothetical protein
MIAPYSKEENAYEGMKQAAYTVTQVIRNFSSLLEILSRTRELRTLGQAVQVKASKSEFLYSPECGYRSLPVPAAF